MWAIKGLFILFVAVLTIDTKVSNDYGTLQLATALAVGLLGFIYLCLASCAQVLSRHAQGDSIKERERRAAEAAKARARSDARARVRRPARVSSSVQSGHPRGAPRGRRGSTATDHVLGVNAALPVIAVALTRAPHTSTTIAAQPAGPTAKKGVFFAMHRP